ncbi:MAG: hypothetical protein NWS31_02590 [Crocinitomicaceae bacterium]|nr:hypothetical protein [Crocinitomicaceae bacterium]
MKLSFKTFLPHLVALVLFVALPSIYFSPLFDGYALKQNDIRQFQGMSKEIFDYRLTHDNDQPYWTNAMFSGMPAYQISVEQNANWLTKVDQLIKFGLPRPVGILFISMLGFYILGLCLRINPWLAMLGAVGYGFSTINILYLGAGHMSKVNSIAYMAPALGGLLLAFRGRWLLGSAVFALFLGLNITANHLQMTYYLAFILGAVALAEVIRMVLSKSWKPLGLSLAGLALASILAVVANAGLLFSTQEYSKLTTRGTSELTIKPKDGGSQAKEGLNKDYILEYNYGKRELLSLYAPNAKGGKGDLIANDPDALADTDPTYAEQVGQMNHYWGGQRMSGGAFYFGVVMLVFFILGLLFVKDVLRWPFLALSILVLYLASNQMNALNDFFIHQFPMYNKFRDSKMLLVLWQIMVPTMGLLFLDKLVRNEGLLGQKKYWYGAMGGLLLIAIMLVASPSLSGSFMTNEELKQFADAGKQAKDASQTAFYQGMRQAVIDARITIYKADMQRSLFLVILALGVVVLFLRTKMNRMGIIAITGVLVLADQMSVAKRYLNNDDSTGTFESYQTLDEASVPYPVSPADMSILQQEKPNAALAQKLLSAYADFDYYKNLTDQNTLNAYAAFGALNLSSNYRVLNVNGTMAETNTSFFHKSLGGYHGAKLKRYQEFVDFHFPAAVQAFSAAVNTAKNEKFRTMALPADISQEQAQQIFDTLSVSSIALGAEAEYLNMLNTKYIILKPNQPAILNTNANGPAWFVADVKMVKDANQEILGSGSKALLDSKKQAVVHQEFKAQLKGLGQDSMATIKLRNYDPSELRYASNSKAKQLAVFSEMYYPAGWNCYIDGKKSVANLRVNYLLRGVVVPAGKHDIVWKFEPLSVQSGNTLASVGSGLLLLGFLLALWFTYKHAVRPAQAPQK